MKIDTTRFGQIEINSDDIINIPEGPAGFPDCTRFVFVDKENELPFRTLQSLDTPTLAFIVISPQTVRPNYRIDITLDDLKLIEADSIENVDVYVIVEVHQNIDQITVNLQAPIVINTQKQLGHQFILSNTDYGLKESFRYPHGISTVENMKEE
jgi:flagellar assembly factor FliW